MDHHDLPEVPDYIYERLGKHLAKHLLPYASQVIDTHELYAAFVRTVKRSNLSPECEDFLRPLEALIELHALRVQEFLRVAANTGSRHEIMATLEHSPAA